MKINVIKPHMPISPYIHTIWVMESDGRSKINSKLPFFADGCPGIMYHQTENGLYSNDGTEKKKLSNFFIHGQTVKPIEITPKGGYRIIIFFMFPHVTKALFGLNSNELTDNCLDLGLLIGTSGTDMAERLKNTLNASDQVSIISAFLVSLIFKNDRKMDSAIQAASTHILKANGKITMKEIWSQLQMSERTFERKFKEHVGISPRLFSRINQFQSSLGQLKKQEYTKLSDVAFDNGYTDQSHFIRAFKEFTGFSPLKFQRSYLPVVSKFPDSGNLEPI